VPEIALDENEIALDEHENSLFRARLMLFGAALQPRMRCRCFWERIKGCWDDKARFWQ